MSIETKAGSLIHLSAFQMLTSLYLQPEGVLISDVCIIRRALSMMNLTKLKIYGKWVKLLTLLLWQRETIESTPSLGYSNNMEFRRPFEFWIVPISVAKLMIEIIFRQSLALENVCHLNGIMLYAYQKLPLHLSRLASARFFYLCRKIPLLSCPRDVKIGQTPTPPIQYSLHRSRSCGGIPKADLQAWYFSPGSCPQQMSWRSKSERLFELIPKLNPVPLVVR